MGVRGELGLVPIKLPPIDVTLAVILEQDLPVFKGSAVAVALAGAAIDDLDPLLAFAVGVGTLPPIIFPGRPERWWGDEALKAETDAPQATLEQRHQAA